ncbi:MAG TPA: ATP-dependent metallopeptidase FtsH/Yme1/Tma family protein, partial [Alphaproteobacteria bacterium]|nr:ATP-dependent metallopeptidase FtsH/Yme1/Tma family protein [Alphaproteobacteria bacterium]
MNLGKNLALWVIIGLLLVALFNIFQGPGSHGPQAKLAFSDFISEVDRGQVSSVNMQGQTINGHFSDGRAFSTYAPQDPGLVNRLIGKGVRISAAPSEEGTPSLLGVLLSWFPMLLLIGVWVFFMRQMQAGGGKAMGFGKSRARLLTEKVGRVT